MKYEISAPINVPGSDLILLDLNLPKKDGREVLEKIKLNTTPIGAPVVILTTSMSDEDILGSYPLGVNSYITKPADLDVFLRVVKGIDSFWMSVAGVPKKPCP